MGAKQSHAGTCAANPFEAVHPASVRSVKDAEHLAAAFIMEGSKKTTPPAPAAAAYRIPPYAII
jgi:hypothetical protein